MYTANPQSILFKRMKMLLLVSSEAIQLKGLAYLGSKNNLMQGYCAFYFFCYNQRKLSRRRNPCRKARVFLLAENINSLIQKVQVVRVEDKLKTTSTTRTTDLENNYDYECDQLYTELSDLVNRKFRMWYLNKFYRLGRQRILELASIARADGNDPKRYFSKLLKEAV